MHKPCSIFRSQRRLMPFIFALLLLFLCARPGASQTYSTVTTATSPATAASTAPRFSAARLASAVELLEEAQSLVGRMQPSSDQIFQQTRLAYAWNLAGSRDRYEKAIDQAGQSLANMCLLEYDRMQCDLLLAKAALSAGDLQTAREWITQARFSFERLDKSDPSYQVLSYELTICYSRMGDFDSACRLLSELPPVRQVYRAWRILLSLDGKSIQTAGPIYSIVNQYDARDFNEADRTIWFCVQFLAGKDPPSVSLAKKPKPSLNNGQVGPYNLTIQWQLNNGRLEDAQRTMRWCLNQYAVTYDINFDRLLLRCGLELPMPSDDDKRRLIKRIMDMHVDWLPYGAEKGDPDSVLLRASEREFAGGEIHWEDSNQTIDYYDRLRIESARILAAQGYLAAAHHLIRPLGDAKIKKLVLENLPSPDQFMSIQPTDGPSDTLDLCILANADEQIAKMAHNAKKTLHEAGQETCINEEYYELGVVETHVVKLKPENAASNPDKPQLFQPLTPNATHELENAVSMAIRMLNGKPDEKIIGRWDREK